MSLRSDDKDWIRKTVDEQLNPIKRSIQTLQPTGTWKKLLHFVKEWIGVTPLIGTLAFAGAGWSAANSRLEKEVEFRTRTDERLTSLQAEVRILQASQSPGKVVKEIAHLPPNEFAQNLPALRKAAEQTLTNGALSRATLLEVSGKLRATDTSAPAYWPTVLQFLRFASRGISPIVRTGMIRLVIGNNQGFPSFGTITDREVLLGGGELGPTRFEKCKIIFTEHEVKMRNVKFADCVFEFPSTELPNSYLRSAGQAILASDIKYVVISGR